MEPVLHPPFVATEVHGAFGDDRRGGHHVQALIDVALILPGVGVIEQVHWKLPEC